MNSRLQYAALPGPDPFTQPDVIVKRMGREEFLDMLRERINIGYMPTSKRKEGYNSKPEYVRHVDPNRPDVPHVTYRIGSYEHGEYVTFDSDLKYSQEGLKIKDPAEIFVDLQTGTTHFMVGLTSLLVLVRCTTAGLASNTNNLNAYVEWPQDSTETLALDREQLRKALEYF